MLSADEQPGIFTFLVGMIVLVMTGVGLSLVADRYLKNSKGGNDSQREIMADAEEIEEMSERYENYTAALARENLRLHAESRTHREILAGSRDMHERTAALENSRIQIRESISALEGQFSAYRANYCRQARAAAKGESLGTLTVRDGRTFQQATITRVTEVGMEIRHEHGIARIQAPDLAPPFHDRFQWNDEERRTRLKEELENQLAHTASLAVEKPTPGKKRKPKKKLAPRPPDPPEEIQKVTFSGNAEKTLKQARLMVSGWTAKVSKLKTDKAEASMRAVYGNQSSVPGSLETWGARAARLGNELLHAQGALAAAKMELAGLNPDDPLLQPAGNEE